MSNLIDYNYSYLFLVINCVISYFFDQVLYIYSTACYSILWLISGIGLIFNIMDLKYHQLIAFSIRTDAMKVHNINKTNNKNNNKTNKTNNNNDNYNCNKTGVQLL